MKDTGYGILIAVVALVIIVLFSVLFANCYSEHRTDGLGFWATISTCS